MRIRRRVESLVLRVKVALSSQVGIAADGSPDAHDGSFRAVQRSSKWHV